MNDLKIPKNWDLKTLSEVCEINPSKSEVKDVANDLEVSFVPMKNVDDIKGIIKVQDTKTLGEVRKGYTYFKDRDVIFAKITPCMENGKIAIGMNLKNNIGFASTEFHVLRPKDMVLSEWIHYFLRNYSFRMEAKNNFTGSAGQKRVPKEFLASYFIPIPPIETQQEIIQKLNRILRQVEEKKNKISRLKIPTQEFLDVAYSNILDEAFSGMSTKNWRKNTTITTSSDEILEKIKSKYNVKKFEKPFQDISFLIPKTWIWTQLGHLCDLLSGKVFQENEYSDSGIRLLQIANVSFGKIIWEKIKFLPNSYEKSYSKFVLLENDVLIALNRPVLKNKLKIGIIKKSDSPSILYQRVGKLIFYDVDLTKYLFYYMQSPFFVKKMKDSFRGSDQPFINKGNLLSLPVPIPPLPEQKQIVKLIEEKFSNFEIYFDKIKQIEFFKNQINRYLNILPSAILSKAFSGELIN